MIKNYNTDEINHLIQNRRSVYPAQYSGEIVDDAIIEQMLENANWAPNHKKTEPWRFTVFTGKGLEQLGQFQAATYKKVSEARQNFNETTFETLMNKPMQASHVIAIGMKRHDILPEIEEVAAVAAAVQNMYLTATAYGVGSYWGSGGITYMEEAKEAFGLEAADKLLGFLFVGMPKEGFWPESKRGEIADKVSWVRD